MSEHECRIVKLKDQKWIKEANFDKNVFATQHLSSFQMKSDEGYFAEAANAGLRGAQSYPDVIPGIMDICCSPTDLSADNVRESILVLIKEKVINDIIAANALIEKMVKDGKLEEGEVEIERWEVASKLLEGVFWENPLTEPSIADKKAKLEKAHEESSHRRKEFREKVKKLYYSQYEE